MSLENAPDEVKLAIDLIVLLEQHAVPVDTVLAALEIVQRDYLRKKEERKASARSSVISVPIRRSGAQGSSLRPISSV